jgi:hypothetical protein
MDFWQPSSPLGGLAHVKTSEGAGRIEHGLWDE